MFLNLGVQIGRMVADPQSGENNGHKYARFTLAVGRPYIQEGKRPADFVDVVVFNEGLARIVTEGGRKGRLVAVTGEWRSRVRDVGGTKIKEWSLHADTIRWLDVQARTAEEPHEEAHEEMPNISEDDLPF